jgi:hypothetical protein
MKTQILIPMTALALLLAACVAPMPTTPKLQLPGSEKPQLPLEQQTKRTNPLELPAAPAKAEKPFVFTADMVGRTDPSAYPAEIEAVVNPVSEAVQRQQAQQELYEAGYQPPNAWLSIGRTDPSAYPAEIEQIVNSAPMWATDPSAYPAEIEQVMTSKASFVTDPSAYPAEIEQIVNSAPMWATDPSAYPAEIEQIAVP